VIGDSPPIVTSARGRLAQATRAAVIVSGA